MVPETIVKCLKLTVLASQCFKKVPNTVKSFQVKNLKSIRLGES